MLKTNLLPLLFCLLFFSCADKSTNKTSEEATEEKTSDEVFFDLSLAQWSLHRAFFDGEIHPLDFAEEASKMGFAGIEYVNGIYTNLLKEYEKEGKSLDTLLSELKAKSEEYNVKNVLIMVDGEGPLASESEKERNQAVENHKKWVDAAAFLGCHSIRVNLAGSTDQETWIEASIDGLTKLATYAKEKNINVIVENHGGFSSNGELLMQAINGVNMENCGTLPDFGNFCISGGGLNSDCENKYDPYKGVEEMMPKAKAVSAKSYNFGEDGKETILDYQRLIGIVKEAGYTGFIGVEYEGSEISEKEGIQKTKELLIQSAKQLNQ